MIEQSIRRLAPVAALKVYIAAALLVPLILFTLAAAYHFQELRSAALERAARNAVALAEQAQRVLAAQDSALQRVDERIAELQPHELKSASLHRWLRQISDESEYVVAINVLGRDGRALASSIQHPAPSVDASDRNYFRVFADTMREAPYINEPVVGRPTGIEVFQLARRRTSNDHIFQGVVVASVEPSKLAEFYKRVTAPGDSVTLARADGTLLVRYPSANTGVTALATSSGLMRAAAANPLSGVYRTTSVFDGIDRLHAYQKAGSWPVYVSYGSSMAALNAQWRRDLVALGTIAGLASLLMVGVGSVAINRARREQAALLRVGEEEAARLGAEANARAAEERAARAEAELALQASEERLKAITDAMPVLISYVDSDQRFRFANKAYEDWFDRPLVEIVGRHLRDVMGDAAYEVRRPWIERALAGERVTYEAEFLHPTRPRSTTIDHIPHRNQDGRVVGMYALVQDVSDQKATEAALRRSASELANETAALETLNRTGAAIAAELDLERVVQLVTDAGIELTGAQIGAFFYNALNDAGEAQMLYAVSGADRSQFEEFGMPRATAVLTPTFVGEGIIRSDDILADSRYGKAAPHFGLPKGHLSVRSYLAVPVASRSGEVIGGLFFDHPEVARFTERHEALMNAIAAQAAIAIDNARLYQAAQRELEQRRIAEAALRQFNESLEARVASRTRDLEFLYNNTPVPLHSQSPEGILISVSDRWLEFMGYDSRDEVLGRRADEFLTPESASRHRNEYWPRLLANGAADDVEYQAVKRSGEVVDVLISSRLDYDEDGRFVRTMGAVIDITSRKRTEEALRQSQKLEAIGQLTGGVAHDFNNLLTIIRSSVDLLQRDGLPEERRRRYIEAISETADRAAKLTSQLLAFARRQTLKPEVFDAGERVLSVCEMIKAVVGSRVQLDVQILADPALVEADIAQFETALVNLAVNARDAMGGAGCIKVVVQATSDALAPGSSRADGDRRFVAISVADTGHGIPADKQSQIFEPFFTTKDVGKGTGLGLSQVYGFAKQSGGEVAVESEVGRGTTFTLYLPRAEQVVQRVEGSSGKLTPAVTQARILVVEDNVRVGEFATQILREFGHKPVWVQSAEAALELLATNAHGFDMIFSDVVMPGIGGIALAQEVRRRYPKLRVVLTSGYSEVLAEEGHLGFDLLHKPYSLEALSQMLDRLLVVERETA